MTQHHPDRGSLVRVKGDRGAPFAGLLGIVIGPSAQLREHVDVCFNNKIWSIYSGNLERVSDQTLL